VRATPRHVVLLVAAALLTACSGSPHHGTLSGRLYVVGGPSPGAPRAVDGTVVGVGPSGRHIAKAGGDGHYTMHLPVGTHAVSGTSPSYNNGLSPCVSTAMVTVTKDHLNTNDVWCLVR
jgi:hypothetical protein